MQKEFHRPQVINMPEGLEMLIGIKNANDMAPQCPHCHQQTLVRPIHLTKKSVSPLRKMAELGAMTAKQIHEQFGRTAYANYTQLKYWGFIAEVDGGKWTVTDTGRKFVADLLRVPEVLWIYNDRARVVPQEMYGRWVCATDLIPAVEIDRQSAAANSIPVEVKTQDSLI